MPLLSFPPSPIPLPRLESLSADDIRALPPQTVLHMLIAEGDVEYLCTIGEVLRHRLLMLREIHDERHRHAG